MLEEYARAVYMDGCPLQTLIYTLAEKMQVTTSSNRTDSDVVRERVRSTWRETVTLLLRCGGDKEKTSKSLKLLAKGLAEDGRAASSHVCLIVAECQRLEKDDQNASMVLLGANHRSRQGRRVSMRNAASVLASLCYDMSFQTQEKLFLSPFLVPYIFYYAMRLAEVGLLDMASTYCDLTFSAIQSYEASDESMDKISDFSSNFILMLQVRITITKLNAYPSL